MSRTNTILVLSAVICGAVFVAGLVCPLAWVSCQKPQPPQSRWSLEDLRHHLAVNGLELEARPVRGGVGLPQLYLDAPDNGGTVLVILAQSEEEAAQLAPVQSAHSFAWGRFVFAGEDEALLARIKATLDK